MLLVYNNIKTSNKSVASMYSNSSRNWAFILIGKVSAVSLVAQRSLEVFTPANRSH